MPKRGIAASIILSFVTCGIYGIVWMISLSNEVSRYNGEKEEGGMEFLLSIITCGIYSYFWAYKMGQKLVRAQVKNSGPVTDNSVLYVILAIFIPIVGIAIMQSQANDLA